MVREGRVHLKPTEHADLAIWLITFSLAVLADLVAAVSIGVILPIVQLLRRMSETVEGQVVAAEGPATDWDALPALRQFAIK